MDLFYSWEFWLGLASIFCYMAIPHLYTMANLKDGFVWVPFNNEHYSGGDNRFYAAGVNEARSHFFKYRHPCSNVLGRMAIDFTRAASYRLLAILSLGLKDDRYAFFTSFVLSVLLQYTLLCFLFVNWFPSPLISVFGALAMIFYYKVFLSIISGDKLKSFIYYLYTVSKFTVFERINDNFRYVVMSSAGCFIWISLLFSTYYSQVPYDSLKIASLGFVIVSLLFVYPIVSAYSLFIIFWVQLNELYSKGDWHGFYVLMLGTLASILLFFVFGFQKKIKEIFKSDLEILVQSHAGKESYKYGVKSFFTYVCNDNFFIVSLLALGYLFVMKTPLGNMVTGIFLFIIIARILGYIIKKNNVITRFYERGALHFISFGLIVIGITVFVNIQNHFSIILLYALLGIILLIPLIGSIKASKRFYDNKTFQLPESEWEVYQYMKKNTVDRSNCLAFSYSNLQLIPVYTNANLAVRGAEWLDNPLTELVRYYKALEYINTDSKPFWHALKGFHQIPTAQDSNTAETEKIYSYYHLFKTLIYYPFVERIGHIKLYNEVGKKWNEEFIDLVKHEISTSKENYDETVNYIVIDKEFILHSECRKNYKKIFENSKFQLYQNQLGVS